MRTFGAVFSVWIHWTQVMMVFFFILDRHRTAQVGVLVSFLELAHRRSLAPEDTCTKFGFARLKAIQRLTISHVSKLSPVVTWLREMIHDAGSNLHRGSIFFLRLLLLINHSPHFLVVRQLLHWSPMVR